MRHRTVTKKLGRSTAHREMLLANMVCSLIEKKRITTTLQKAKLVRQLAEKMVTLGKNGSLAARRRAVARLHRKDAVASLFKDIAPQCGDRAGGYVRIIRRGRRRGDGAETAVMEWVTIAPPERKKREKAKEDDK